MATEWNGEGIPPVGTECEATWGGKAFWRRAVILPDFHAAIYHGGTMGWKVRHIQEYDGAQAFEFRPLQSEEQKQVAEIAEIIREENDSDATHELDIAKAIYNAGFRKVVE